MGRFWGKFIIIINSYLRIFIIDIIFNYCDTLQVVPTVHWYFEMGGNENTMVNVNLLTPLRKISCNIFFAMILDFYSPCHRYVHFGNNSIPYLRNKNTRALVCWKTRLCWSFAQFLASFRPCCSLLLA